MASSSYSEYEQRVVVGNGMDNPVVWDQSHDLCRKQINDVATENVFPNIHLEKLRENIPNTHPMVDRLKDLATTPNHCGDKISIPWNEALPPLKLKENTGLTIDQRITTVHPYEYGPLEISWT